VFSKRTLGEDVYNELKERIVTGRIPPGERLMYETLTVELGISKSPLKEAFLRLEREGLVEIVPRRGTFVRRFDTREVQELYQIREVLEGLSARLASLNATDEDIRNLEECCELLEEGLAEEDTNKCLKADLAFHNAVVGASGNEHLGKLIREHVLTNLFAIAGEGNTYVELSEGALRWHRSIIDAVKGRDPDLAEERMKEQLVVGREQILRFVASRDKESTGDESQTPLVSSE